MVTGGAVCSNWACTESVRGEVSDGLPYLDPIVAGEEGEGKTKDSPDLWKRAEECMFVNMLQSF